MKDKVLKLCRRLKKSSLSELTQMLEVDENEIKLALWKLEQEELIVENKLISSKEFIKQYKKELLNYELIGENNETN